MSIIVTILQFWLALSIPASFMAMACIFVGGEGE